MALYCMGVMCSKPGGGTSQYFFTFFFFSRCGERLLEDEKTGEIKVKQSTCNISHEQSSKLLIPMMVHFSKLGTEGPEKPIQADIYTMS